MHVTVSLFDSAKSNRAERETIDFGRFLDDFREPFTSELEPTPDNARVLKLSAPAFSPAIFREDRRKKANIEHAQVLAYDIDEAVNAHELSERLRRRGISYCVHSTTSGRGVHVLIPLARPVDGETYLRYWDEARSLFYGIEVDMSKRGPESLFFAPRIFEANKQGYFFDAVTDAPFLGASGFRPFKPDLTGVDRYVQEVQTCDNKHTTVNRIGFVLGLLGLELEDVKARLLEALRANTTSTPVVDWVSAENTIVSAWMDGRAQKEAEDARPKYVPDAAKSTGKRVLKDAVAGILKGETLGAHAYRVGQFVPHVLEYELVLDELRGAWERAKNHDTRSLDDAVREIVSGLDGGRHNPVGVHEEWQRDLKLTPDGLGFHAGENNVHIVLEKHPDLMGLCAFDVRDGAPVYLSAPPWHAGQKLTYPRRLEDSDRQRLARWVRDQLGVLNVKPATALEALIDLANEAKRDALLDYFKALPASTSTDCIESVLIRTMGAEDSAYVRAVCKKWLIGLVARQFDPGCKMDTVLVLVGDQGMSKSWFFKEIFPPELQKQSYCDSVNLLRLDKDQVVKLNRYACVELPELAGMSKADVETIKMNVTQQGADERVAYARLHAQFPRRAVFGGTTNRDDFLRDPTGGRRFWPITVTRSLDREALRALRSQLWSEAVGAYLRDAEWHLGGAEEALAREIREGFEEEDVLTEKVRDVLACWPGDSKFDDASYVMKPWQLEGSRVVRARLGQLLLKLGYDLGDKPHERRLADCLRRLKWNCRIEQHDGIRYRVWYEKGK
jgi:predicted P-loop ATPase